MQGADIKTKPDFFFLFMEGQKKHLAVILKHRPTKFFKKI